ncbi:AmmeMemoRadiSam system protein B [Candidatus Dojkabacteria bacterium]|nr:AmmeMemoRadiSam system protein B [Candidatus Dojkabacteria bacterium]
MIRRSVFEGSFYPSNKDKLQKLIKDYLEKVDRVEDSESIKALIVPHAGYIYSGEIAAYGYKLLEKDIERILILGLSHRVLVKGIALADFDTWSTPLGEVKVADLNKKLTLEDNFTVVNTAHAQEHSIEVQMPFLQTCLETDFEIIPMVTGQSIQYKNVATILNKYLNRKDVFIVSSDLSHYLPYSRAKKNDKETVKKILKLEKIEEDDRACGKDGINILIELAKLNNWKPKLLDYRNSGDTAGDKSKVVGYASIAFYS